MNVLKVKGFKRDWKNFIGILNKKLNDLCKIFGNAKKNLEIFIRHCYNACEFTT